MVVVSKKIKFHLISYLILGKVNKFAKKSDDSRVPKELWPEAGEVMRC